MDGEGGTKVTAEPRDVCADNTVLRRREDRYDRYTCAFVKTQKRSKNRNHLDTSLDVGAEPLETLIQTISTGRASSLGQPHQHAVQ